MTIDIKRFEELKQEVEDKQRDLDKASGALESLEARLKKEFDCTSVKEAESMLEEFKESMDRLEDDYATELQKFEEKWSEVCND